MHKLLDEAVNARSRAKAGYSGFKVGAAILCSDGKIITGCNIESSSYGLTICAERCAFFTALALGYNKGDFKCLVVAVEGGEPAPPCGACRQIIWEWAPEIEIICVNTEGKQKNYMIKDLFPDPFDDKFI